MSDEHEQTTRSFRPGEWFGIFGEHACVILPPTEKSRVAALWEMVDAGAGFDETLDALIATGLRDLPGFVLVSEVEGETKVVLRGAARARFITADETVDLDGSVATTWVERSLHGVTRMSVEVAEDTAGEDLRLAGGLVRISRVDQPPRSAEPELVDTEPSVGALPSGPPPSEPPHVEPLSTEPPPTEPPPTEPPPVEWFAALEDEPTEAVPLLGGGPWEEQPDADKPEAEQPEAEQPVEDDAGDEPFYEEPPIWVPRPPAPPFGPPVLPPGAPGEEDHDGETRAGGWDPGELAPQQPGIPGQPEAPGVTARPVARLVFSSGESVEVDRAVLVGRAPEARRHTSGEEPRLVVVPSPHHEISSTHLEIRPGSGADHGSAVITDLGSTNGTVLVQPGLPPEDLQPGIAVQLIPGAVVDLGDGVAIQVTNP